MGRSKSHFSIICDIRSSEKLGLHFFLVVEPLLCTSILLQYWCWLYHVYNSIGISSGLWLTCNWDIKCSI